VLILDEPTAVLTPQEVDDLLEIMRNLAEDGRSLIFISHKLQEVTAICGRIAVLRDGQLVDIVPSTTTSRKELARLMVGREVLLRVEKEPATPGEVRLAVRDLHVRDDRGLPALRGIDLDVRAGEIVGVAGVAGNGQRELEDAISGLRRIESGQVLLGDQDMTNRSPREILAGGLGHIPSDRFGMGLLRDFTVSDNLVLETFFKHPFTRWGLLDSRAIASHADRLVEEFDIRTAATTTEVAKLSGGNAQKIILAREIVREPKVLIAAQPTRGLDVGATEYVHRELVRQRDRDMAILLISTEFEEILSLSDRIVVLYEGRVVGELAAEDADVAELGLLMAGSSLGAG
jgi:simple sugar transport system ATP-binding protein